jgi:hypothetical protein
MKMTDRFLFSEKISFLFTFFIWLVITCVVIFIPIKNENKKYNEIQISLSAQSEKNKSFIEETKSITETQKEVLKSQEQNQKNIAAVKKASASIKETENKTSVEKQVSVKKASVREEKLYQSVEELMNLQKSVPKKQAVWDESMFNDASTGSSVSSSITSSEITQTQKIENVFSGTAAKTEDAEIKTSAKESQLEKTDSDFSSGNIQESTEKYLSTLESIAKGKSFATTDEKDEGSFESGKNAIITNVKGSSIKVADGRSILKPEKPTIIISSENQKSLQNITVKFKFTVNSDGTVNYNSIQCTAGAIGREVEKEIREQIARWSFQRGTSSSDAFFDLIISAN